MVKPKTISESDVRITDINVRSALIRVRWKDIPVRRAESSTEISSPDDADVTRLSGAVAMTVVVMLRRARYSGSQDGMSRCRSVVACARPADSGDSNSAPTDR